MRYGINSIKVKTWLKINDQCYYRFRFSVYDTLNKIPQEYGKWFNVNDVFGFTILFLGCLLGNAFFVAINEKDAKKTLHISISQHLLVQ